MKDKIVKQVILRFIMGISPYAPVELLLFPIIETADTNFGFHKLPE